MDELTRRQMLKATSVAGVLLGTGASALARKKALVQERFLLERDFVMEAGMTEAEADCWDDASAFAGAYLRLTPMDSDHEHIHAIHVLQEKLMVRPTYRRYLAAKGGEHATPPDRSLTELAEPVDHEPAVASGLTDEEAECWALLADFARSYAALPKQHPVEDHEVAHAAWFLTAKILARPTLRRYRGEEDE